MFWHGIAQYSKLFFAVQGPSGVSLDDLECFLRLESPELSIYYKIPEIARRLFAFFGQCTGFFKDANKIYASKDWAAEILSIKCTRLSEDGDTVFRTIAASFSHGILATEVCSKTKLDNKQVSRFVKILAENKLVYSLNATLTGSIKEYWGTNVSSIIWATIFLKGRTDDELRSDFEEYTQSREDYCIRVQKSNDQKPVVLKQVCNYLASKNTAQSYTDILEHFIREKKASTVKARKTLNTQLDTLMTALDKTGVIGSYVVGEGVTVYSRYLTAQGLEFRVLSTLRRENKALQGFFHMGSVLPLSSGANFLFLTAAQTLISARQALPTVTQLPLVGIGLLETGLLLPLVWNGKICTLTELLLLQLFHAGDEGLQFTKLKEQYCLTRKVMEWITDSITASFPVVKADESGTFRYWHFPYGPRVLYAPFLDTSPTTSKKNKLGLSLAQRIKHSCACLGHFLQPVPKDVSPLSISNPTSFQQTLSLLPAPTVPANPVLPSVLPSSPLHDVFHEQNSLIMSPLGCFLSTTLELSFVKYDLHKSTAISARAHLILSFFRRAPLYLQQDLSQLVTLLPVEISASFPLKYGFTDLSKRRMDRKVAQRSIEHLLKTGYLLEASVLVGSKPYAVYYRPDICVLDNYPSDNKPPSWFLQDTPDLSSRLEAYVVTLPSMSARDEDDGEPRPEPIGDVSADSYADLPIEAGTSSFTWFESSLPSLSNYASTSLDITFLNAGAINKAAQLEVLDGSTCTEENTLIFQQFCISYTETLAALKASIAQSRRKHTLRRLMLLHAIILHSSRLKGDTCISDLFFCENLTFAEYAYLFPLPENSPLYQLFLSYLLFSQNISIYTVSNPALYLLSMTTFFVTRMGKYREWLHHLDLLHWRLEECTGQVMNYVHQSITHLPPLGTSKLKVSSSTLFAILAAIYSSLCVSGIRAILQLNKETGLITIDLVDVINITTDEDVTSFWSTLEDFCLRTYIALKALADQSLINLVSICNELAVYSLIRSWIFNVEVQLLLQKRLNGVKVTADLHQFMMRAQEAATSLCDTLGQQGTIIHMNAFLSALQKEIFALSASASCEQGTGLYLLPITNITITDYEKLASFAVRLLPAKYLELHFNGAQEGALEYFIASRQSTIDFLIYVMRVSTVTSLNNSEPNCNNISPVLLPLIRVSDETIDATLYAQHLTEPVGVVERVHLTQALMARASIPISYWLEKMAFATRPRRGQKSSLSVNMRITEAEITEYCSISTFTNNHWLLSTNLNTLTLEQLSSIPAFTKNSDRIQRMRTARSSALTAALRRQRRQQKCESQLREDLTFICTSDDGPADTTPDYMHSLTKEGLVNLVSQYRASRTYLKVSDTSGTCLEHAMMHYTSLFRIALPMMQGSMSEGCSVNPVYSDNANFDIQALIKMYAEQNSMRKDFLAYGKIYPMAALSLLSPEIDLLFNLPTVNARYLLLKTFSNSITSIARNTYRERKLANVSETARLAILLHCLNNTNMTRESSFNTLQSRLLFTKDQLIRAIDLYTLKLAFTVDTPIDADYITYIYENRVKNCTDKLQNFISLSNKVTQLCSAYSGACSSFSVLDDISAETFIYYLLIQYLPYKSIPVLECSIDQTTVRLCYSTHHLLIKRAEYIEHSILARGGDSVQNLIEFLSLPHILSNFIYLLGQYPVKHEDDCFLKSIKEAIAISRNENITKQHRWAIEIKAFIGQTLWNQTASAATIGEHQLDPLLPSTEEKQLSCFSRQYLLASGYMKYQKYTPFGYSVVKTLQKASLIPMDNRRRYRSNQDIGAISAQNAFLLLPSIAFGINRQQYYILGSSIDSVAISKLPPANLMGCFEEDPSYSPVEDILEAYATFNDPASAMIGDTIEQCIHEMHAEITCSLADLTNLDNRSGNLLASVNLLNEEYARDPLGLTTFNFPTHAETLISSGLFVPKRLLTETTFVPLSIFESKIQQDYFCTEFSICAPSSTSTKNPSDYPSFNAQEIEVSLRQIVALISFCPGISLDRLCTSCIPLTPATVCQLVNLLIWDVVVEARILIRLAGGNVIQKVINDLLQIDSMDFSRVFLSANSENLGNEYYNSYTDTIPRSQ